MVPPQEFEPSTYPLPLGSAPAPRSPRVLPPLSAPLPLTPASPGALCSVSVTGTGDAVQSRSRTFAAPAPPAASHWRRAAASRRTARRSLAACPRSRATLCQRASTWPCARSWGAIQGGAMIQKFIFFWIIKTIAACRFSSLFVSLLLFAVFKAVRDLGSSPKNSNPQPPAPLGSAPAPRAPRVLPPLSAPLPLTPAPPGSLRSGSVYGTGDVATPGVGRWRVCNGQFLDRGKLYVT